MQAGQVFKLIRSNTEDSPRIGCRVTVTDVAAENEFGEVWVRVVGADGVLPGSWGQEIAVPSDWLGPDA